MKLDELDKKSAYEKYLFEKANFYDLFNIFVKNANTEDFKYSRRAGLTLVFLPTIVNIYFGFINPYNMFKNIGRISIMLGCIYNFQYQIFQDFGELAKKDTPIANKLRMHFQNITFDKINSESYSEETLKVYSKFKFF